MTNDLARVDEGRSLQRLEPEQIEVLKSTVCQGASDAELELFLAIAARTGLDPFIRQIQMIQINTEENGRWRRQMVPVVGIDGLRLQARRSSKYRGRLGPYWCGEDGEWKDVWLSDEHPAAARVGILHSDFDEPIWQVARWSDYARRTKNGKLMAMWEKMDAHMLAKCAEAGGLRSAFPAETSALYLDAELWQAGGDRPSEPRGRRKSALNAVLEEANGEPEPPIEEMEDDVVEGECVVEDEPEEDTGTLTVEMVLEELAALEGNVAALGAFYNKRVSELPPGIKKAVEPRFHEAMERARGSKKRSAA